ncbi:MAG: maleylpyruvate isomerase family mycothiol-dependent enzyme, partial [Arenicellales bacterium]|nr:maleylpyruvate isomerase family mycothiol-dependent enzyme [Arenicellales bacterium]
LLEFIDRVKSAIPQIGMRQFETHWINGLAGRVLVSRWREYYTDMATRWVDADPRVRLKWAGPDMSVLSSITARLMETWAHGQAVYDLLGIKRVDTDRIQNIAVLGVNTFKWTFLNRSWTVPDQVPGVELVAPSGECWSWNESNRDDRVSGSATEFCQVVTQTRNIADTQLKVSGPIAECWMANAQCFAGPPETPPVAGTRTSIT